MKVRIVVLATIFFCTDKTYCSINDNFNDSAR